MDCIFLEDRAQRIPLPLGGGATDFNAAVQAAKKRYAGLFKKLALKQQWELTSDQGHRLPLQNAFPPAKK